MKAQALADHLAENPVDDEYQPLNTYFPNEEVNSVKVISTCTNAWKMFFDGVVNAKGVGIGAILISPTGQHYLATARLRFFCTNNTVEYEAYIMGMNMEIDQDVEELLIMGDSDLIIRQAQGVWETRDVKLIPYRQHVEDLSKRFKSVEFRYILRFHNELVDALATLASILPYSGNLHIDPLEIQIRERHGYCNTVKVESDVQPCYLMREICKQFKITHRNSTPYRPKANGAVEAANKNIKMILRKMIQSSRQWHEKLSFTLLGYRTTVRTSVGMTPYLLVYGTETVIPTEVEIPSLQIIVEAEIEDDEWVKARLEQLTLIDEKRMTAVCHGQLYQQRMARAYNKNVQTRNFEVGQLVLRRILYQEAKRKFAPNWKGPYIIRKLLPKGALYLGDIEGNDPEIAVNADAVKRYYV
ncbi:uncharacterized protein [Nicotiana sylvestris]|uniref:uncharacterized protein n=1 Tax=Nicotiana sylvestris TaxID=4096 RepID=UPI00388C7D3A